MSNKFDAIVVGLGAVGSASLYQLSKIGLKVVGLDRYSLPTALAHHLERVGLYGEGFFYTPMVLSANEIWN